MNMPHRQLYILLLLFIATGIGLLYVMLPVIQNVFYFTFDQGRDLLWVRNQVVFQKPSLIGPWGSLAGLFFGPLWFWLLILPYVATGGNPVGITIFNALFVFACIYAVFFLLKKHSQTTAVFTVILAMLSPGIHGIASYEFSEHLLPLLTFLYLYALAKIWADKSTVHIYLAFFWTALMYHAQPAMTALSFLPLLWIVYLVGKEKRWLAFNTWLLSALAFTAPFIPTLLFDLKHGFLQTKAVLSFFTGTNTSLGDILPFWMRVVDRPATFFSVFEHAVFQQFWPLALGGLIVLCYYNYAFLKDSFLRTLWKVSVIYVLSLLILFIMYPPQLKTFYLDGLLIVFILWTALALSVLWKKESVRILLVGGVTILLFWNLQPYQFLQATRNGYQEIRKSTSIYANQKAAVDWIYHDSPEQFFKVYTYSPAVYDYPYQYLFLWYGYNTYGYLPEEFAYLPNQPEYVQLKTASLAKVASPSYSRAAYFYLIIEPDDYSPRKQKWLEQFPEEQYPVLRREYLPDQTVIEKRLTFKNS